MAYPFPFIEGQTYLVSRKVKDGLSLLRPGSILDLAIVYLLAAAMKRTGIHVHAVCASCDRIRLVLTDPAQKLPAFMHWFDREVALVAQEVLGLGSTLWKAGSYEVEPLLSEEDVVWAMGDVFTDPCRFGLVASSGEWPGVRLGPWTLPMVAARPAVQWLRHRALSFPLVLTPPPALSHLSREAYVCRVLQEVARREEPLMGTEVLGAEAVKAMDPFARTPPDVAWSGGAVVARTPQEHELMKARRRAFVKAHEEARDLFASGEHDVEFPVGTYWMARFAGARVMALAA